MSWHTVKDEGMVLWSSPFRERDRLYTLLTRNHGKVRVLGRGAQKQSAKLAPFLEPFGTLHFEWIEGRRSTTIISAERLIRFSRLEQDYAGRNLAQITSQSLHRYLRDYDEHSEMYDLHLDWLQELNREPVDSYTRKLFMLGGFFLRFLNQMGYQTELQSCLVCQGEIMPLAYRWHGGKGGLVCSDCVRKDEREWHSATYLHEDVLRLLRFTDSMLFSDLRHMSLPGSHVVEFIKVIDDLMKYHLPEAEEKPFWNHVFEDFALDSFLKTK